MADLPRAVRVLPPGGASATGRVVLDAETRRRRRLVLETVEGHAFLLDLDAAPDLRQGDLLALDDGGFVAVEAAQEALLEVRGRDSHHLLRLAWHLGNRHLAVGIEQERLLIQADHVIAAMLEGLGATVRPVREAFQPEGGAYGHHHG